MGIRSPLNRESHSLIDLRIRGSRFQRRKVFTSMLVSRGSPFDADSIVQIPELIEFEDRLENSLQRDLAKMEHVRMRIFHEPVNTDLTDMELIELKFIFARRKFI